MPTRNVVLTDHQATFVEQLVASGRYQNASEVLREGLRLIERLEQEEAARLVALRFHGTVSAEVAGIIATTFALNGMLWRGWDSLNAKYELLLEFIGGHPDAITIRRALD